VTVPAGPAADFAFRPTAAGRAPASDNPFADDDSADPGDETETRPRTRRPTARPTPTPGFNPFDGDSVGEPTAGPPKKRHYRKDGDYNPFGDGPDTEDPDPAGDGFDFGIETPRPAPAGEFDFGPLDPRGDDPDRRRRR
jgi:hypothetical protein